MPKKYSKNCDYCGNHYKGLGARFCSKDCWKKANISKPFLCKNCGNQDFEIRRGKRRCVPCIRLKARQGYDRNKTKIREKQKQHRRDNRDDYKQKQNEYYHKNKEHISTLRKQARAKDVEVYRKQGKKSYLKNKNKIIQYQQNYYTKNRAKILKKQREKLTAWSQANLDRARELDVIQKELKRGVITKPLHCPRCHKEEISRKMYAHLNSWNRFLGFLCSMCHGELYRRRRTGEIIKDDRFRKELINKL